MKARHKKIPKKIRTSVHEKYNGHCAYCGCVLDYKNMQIDHIIPKYREETGAINTETIDNYNPACRMCNFYKGSMDIETFRKNIGLLRERLEKIFIYRLAKRYAQVVEWPQDVIFYFERFGQVNDEGE